MGEVHLVHDRWIGRDVAYKSMRAIHALDDSLRRRFTREACVQGQLEPPAVVPVYDFARAGDGEDYFTMRRVQGRSLRDVLRALRAGDESVRERFGQRRLLSAFATLCQAVSYAHDRGVIHRDIKPSNVMLGDFGEVYLFDWGVARLTQKEEPASRESQPVLVAGEHRSSCSAASPTNGPTCTRWASCSSRS